jgi:uncharacterized protein with GYD domain
MAFYLFQGSYTAEALATQIKNPKNRIQTLKPFAKKLRGRIVNGWLSFGDYDVVGIGLGGHP